MSSAIFKFNSAADTTARQASGSDAGAVLTGYEFFNGAAAARFVKLYWGSPGTFSGNSDTPTVGTDLPNMTIQIAATAAARLSYTSAPRGRGRLFYAVTVNAVDTDTTAGSAGDVIGSLFIE